MSELKNIPLANISMIKNYRDVEPPSEKDADVIELSKSIEKHGVMQAVLLRPHTGKPDHYQLIFGHRRYLASKVAKQTTIPATIKEIKDDEILELQVTENLQRKDVHPIDEAIAFKSLMDDKKYSIEEIAARFAKKPEFIAQRLKLVDLIPEAQKLFKANKMLLGHAILLCRISADDQKETIKNRGSFGAVKDLEDYLDRHVVRDLSKATFDIKDEKLFPQAGACTNCPKRSGCNKLLFADIKSPDRCADKGCYTTKTEISFRTKLTEIIETKPEVHLLQESYSTLPKFVNDLLQKMKVAVLKGSGDAYSTHTYSGSRYTIKAKGFKINGYDAGKMIDIYLPGKGKGAVSKDGKPDVNVLIMGIKERADRAKVLDTCKVHASIVEEAMKKKELTSQPFPLQKIDRGIMIFLLLSIPGFHSTKIPGVPDYPTGKGYKEDYFKKLSELNDQMLGLIIRRVIKEKFALTNLQWGVDADETPIRMIADYLKVDIAGIEAAQKEIADKRQARADERIAALKKPKVDKPAGKKVDKPAAAKKAVKKAVAKKSAPKKVAKKKGKGVKALLE